MEFWARIERSRRLRWLPVVASIAFVAFLVGTIVFAALGGANECECVRDICCIGNTTQCPNDCYCTNQHDDPYDEFDVYAEDEGYCEDQHPFHGAFVGFLVLTIVSFVVFVITLCVKYGCCNHRRAVVSVPEYAQRVSGTPVATSSPVLQPPMYPGTPPQAPPPSYGAPPPIAPYGYPPPAPPQLGYICPTVDYGYPSAPPLPRPDPMYERQQLQIPGVSVSATVNVNYPNQNYGSY